MRTEQEPKPEQVPWMVIALLEVGTKERLRDGALNPKIHEYFQATKYKTATGNDAWCAAFQCWCLQKAGKTHPNSAAARDFLTYGTMVSPEFAQDGDLLVFDRHDAANPRAAHVGLYAGKTPTHYWVLAGNKDNQVKIAQEPKAKLLSGGIRRPPA